MDKQGIIDYVLDTPTNTNPRILGHMLDEYADGGGGSSDFTTARVTFTSSADSSSSVKISAAHTYEDLEEAFTMGSINLAPNESESYNVILYKGSAIVTYDGNTTVALEGDAVEDQEWEGVRISGDCVITLTVAPK